MGNPNAQPDPKQHTQSSTSINHFSHPHPLQLSNQSQNSCSGCELDASGGLVYSCTICNYVLHKKCSQMPQQITHPSDPKHVLSLLPKPVYAQGVYKCDACWQQGNGFSYHCQSCGIDFHILCASMPMTMIHQSHQHQLNLTFSPPYPSKTFSCDLCKRAGSNHWLYRCNTCEFDVHLTCINKQTSQPPAQQTTNPPISHQPMYSVQQTIQQAGPGSPFQPQFQQPMFQNMVTRPMLANPNNFVYSTNQNMVTRPMLANPNNFVYSTNPVNASNLNPISYSPFMSGARVQNRPQAQIFAQPYARTRPMQQSLLPMPNYMNTGAVGAAGYGQQNMLMDQMIIDATNGVASGASQAITGALVTDFMGGGNGTNDGGNFDMGFGGVVDMNGYNATADVMTMDQGTYGFSDYGYDQNQMDAGIMAGEMNQMMDENQFDAEMAGADMSHMQ